MGDGSIRQNEAKLRLRNTERLRRNLWISIGIRLKRGQLTEREASQLRQKFWEDRLRDKKLAAKVFFPRKRY
jgi:hypothetical protein